MMGVSVACTERVLRARCAEDIGPDKVWKIEVSSARVVGDKYVAGAGSKQTWMRTEGRGSRSEESASVRCDT